MASKQLTNKQKGQHFEAVAEAYLQSHGLVPITRNFHSRYGEIDLIMKDKACYVFIEVKYRRNTHYGSAVQSVTPSKQQKLKATASIWLQQNQLSETHNELRFDIIAIEGHNHHIEWFTNTLVEG